MSNAALWFFTIVFGVIDVLLVWFIMSYIVLDIIVAHS